VKATRLLKTGGLALALGLALISAAACIRYQAKPIEPGRVLEDFEARRLDAPELGSFLIGNKEVESWPPPAWDLKALTLAALYYHPDMDIARAQWGVANGGRITAGQRPNPSLNPAIGYNATSPTSEVTPWIPEISLDLTIETAGKRGIRIARAGHQSDAARWNIFAAAWDVRSRLRASLLDLHAASERESLLAAEARLQGEAVRLLELQKDAGEASVYDLTQARIGLDSSRLASIEAARAREDASARLAGALGVSRRALDGLAFSFDAFRRPAAAIPTAEIRRQAVLNRSDILSALSEYAASESALRLEIANQYPDLHIGPNYQLDQTDSKWTIGLAFDLPILNKNKGPIAEAMALREESAARFLALQAAAIGELDAAVEDYRAALLKAKTADDLLGDLTGQERAARTRLELGEISRAEYVGIQLELNAGAQARLEALVQAQEAVGRLENAAQSPLDVKDWITTMARTPAIPEKERKDD
jgi:cobalt-zinc-cadmium efflux system outer membrane protein